MSEPDLTPVSVERNGRVLTGVGVTAESLEKTMDRHEPEPKAAPADADSGTDAAPASDTEAASQAHREPKGRQRFSQLTSERDAERQRAAAAEQERDRLKAELEAARQPAKSAEQPRPAVVEAKPAEKFTYPTYAEALAKDPSLDYDDWRDAKEEARTDWKLGRIDLDARIYQTLESQRATQTQAERVSAARERGRKLYPDFDAVLSAPHAQVQWPMDKIQAIAAMDEPEHIQYALAKDPALAERLRTEPNLVTFGLALARLVPADPSAASPASTGIRTVSSVPAPYQPVGSGTRTTVLPSAALVSKAGFDFDKSGYREKRAAELGRNRR